MGKGIYLKVQKASVSSANYQKVLTFTIPAPSPIRIVDISLSPDAVFSSTGKFGLSIGGQTNETSGQSLPSALDIPIGEFRNEETLPDGKKVKGLILNTGDTIEIFASNSSGTGAITAVVLGEIV
jgi:hypothetical protein